MRRLAMGWMVAAVIGAFGVWGCGDAGEEPEPTTDNDEEYGQLHGEVHFEDGGPAAVAGVHAEVTVDGDTREVDEDGVFSFGEVEPGIYTVVASMEGFRDDTADAEVVAGESTVVELLLADEGLECTGEEMSVGGECRLVCTDYGTDRCEEDEYCDEDVGACLPDDCPEGEQKRNLDGEPECLDVCDGDDDCGDDRFCAEADVCMPSECPDGETLHTHDGQTQCRTVCDGDGECGDDELCDDEDDVCLPDDGDDYEWDDTDYPPPTCEADPQPDRCSADPQDFEFGPASVIDELALADEDCCFDYNDDGDNDNTITALVDLADDMDVADVSRDEINAELQAAIDDGTLEMIFEYDGLEEVETGQEFVVNILPADSVDDGEATIDPASFDEGTHPHSMLLDGSIEEPEGELELTAGPGQLVLPPEFGEALLFGVELEEGIKARQVRMVATPVASSAQIEDGVILEAGRLGGVVLLEDIIDLFNETAAGCDCLDNPDPALTDEGTSCEIEDAEDKVDDCEDAGNYECAMLGELCGGFGLLAALTDIDTSDDGETDAYSVGVEFEADATIITGVAAD